MINVIPKPRVAVEEEGFYALLKDVIAISYDGILGNMRQ